MHFFGKNFRTFQEFNKKNVLDYSLFILNLEPIDVISFDQTYFGDFIFL